MPEPVEYKVVRVDTRADIPNPPVPGTEYRIADEGMFAAALRNGILEYYGKSSSVFMTQADYDALESPADSGLYPSLAGKRLVVYGPTRLFQVEVQANGYPVMVSITENALVHKEDLADGTDLDAIMFEGIYDVPSGNTYLNAPTSDPGFEGILTVLRSGGSTKQRFEMFDPDVITYERVHNGAWGEWKRVLYWGDSLGPS
jgi:hypothetical protein